MATIERSGTRPELDAPAPAPPLPRSRRPGRTPLLMAVAAVIVGLATYVALRDRDVTYRVLYAAEDVRAGTTLSERQFAIDEISIDERRLEQLVSADSVARLGGYVAANDLAEGDLVNRSDLREPAAPVGLRAMSVPVDTVKAVGGDLRPGDRVDVISVGEETVSYLATDLDLLAVAGAGADNGAALAGGGAFHVVVAVDDAVALELARAVEREAVHVVRSTGADPADAAPLDAPPPTANDPAAAGSAGFPAPNVGPPGGGPGNG